MKALSMLLKRVAKVERNVERLYTALNGAPVRRRRRKGKRRKQAKKPAAAVAAAPKPKAKKKAKAKPSGRRSLAGVPPAGD